MASRRALAILALFAGSGCAPAAGPPPAPPVDVPITPAPEAARPEIPDPGRPTSNAEVDRLTAACLAPGTSEVDRARIVQYLASIKSAAGERCYLHALRVFKPGVNEEAIGVASEAVAALGIEAARAPLFEAFTRLRASRAHGAYRPVYEAMVAVADPAWEPKLIAYLDRPIDLKDNAAATDEMFWQQTAVVVLGRLKSAAAVEPLMRVLFTDEKESVHADVVMALARIGAPALAAASAALKKGGDDRLRGERLSRVGLVAATIGGRAAAGPILDAIDAATDPVDRAMLAYHLPLLPTGAKVIAAYREAVEKLPPAATINRRPAREALLERAAAFYDAGLVPWLADTSRKLTGAKEDVAAARETAFIAALKLARADQVKHVDAMAARGGIGKAYPREIEITRDLLATCGARADCFLDEIARSTAEKDGGSFRGVKAAYMAGALGDAAVKGKLAAMLPQLTNLPVVFTALGAIDHLSPDGDAALAGRLSGLADQAAQDPPRRALATMLRATAVRLQARAR